jgi:hypothetical protein
MTPSTLIPMSAAALAFCADDLGVRDSCRRESDMTLRQPDRVRSHFPTPNKQGDRFDRHGDAKRADQRQDPIGLFSPQRVYGEAFDEDAQEPDDRGGGDDGQDDPRKPTAIRA